MSPPGLQPAPSGIARPTPPREIAMGLRIDLVGVLAGHTHWVHTVDWSNAREPDVLVSGSFDRTCRLWRVDPDLMTDSTDAIHDQLDPVTVPEIQPLSVHLHGCRVRSCAMANAAHRFASTSAADLHIWDMAGAASTPLSSCSILKEGELETCVWLNNNEIAAAGSKDHTIGILDGRIGRVISRLEGHNATVNWVTCNGERLMASGSKDGSVVIWDMRAGGLCQPVHRIACSKAGVRLCKFSTPDVIGIGSYDRTWRNYSISSRSFVGTEWKHNGWIFGAAISDRLGIIATGAGNPDYSIHVWDRDTDDYLATLPGNQDHAPCLAFAPSAHNLLVNGSKDNQLVIRRISRAIS